MVLLEWGWGGKVRIENEKYAKLSLEDRRKTLKVCWEDELNALPEYSSRYIQPLPYSDLKKAVESCPKQLTRTVWQKIKPSTKWRSEAPEKVLAELGSNNPARMLDIHF